MQTADMYISGVGAYLPDTVDVGQAVAAGWHPPEEEDLHQLGGAAAAGDAGSALVLDTEPGFARLLSVSSVSVSAAEEMHRSAEPLFPPGITEGRIVDFAAHNDTFRQRAVADGGTGVLVTMHERLVELIEETP